jgi:DNA-directed RNA polymerase subunit RPC12/RpoP
MQNLSEIQTVNYRCSKCGHVFSKTLPSSIPAIGQGGSCPMCGERDNPSKLFEATPILRNAQILME